MAQFQGSIKEFTRFIGPFARLKVAFLAAKYKRQIGKCEECGVPDSLDAAHMRGKGRVSLIANILSEFMEDDVVNIDLGEFEERFVNAHLPIESTIRILCKKCHRHYDSGTKGASNDELPLREESIVIENLINNQMNKSKALHLIRKNLPLIATFNTIFSNVSLPDSWWLQSDNDKFKTDLHIILNDNRLCKLYVFKLPANLITNASRHFKQRNDRYRTNCSDIFIPVSGSKFIEKNGFDFTPYKIQEFGY